MARSKTIEVKMTIRHNVAKGYISLSTAEWRKVVRQMVERFKLPYHLSDGDFVARDIEVELKK